MAVAKSWASSEDTTCVISAHSSQQTLTVRQVYLNIVLDDALEEKAGGEKSRIGMVVIRGNSVVMIEVRTFESLVMWVWLTRHSGTRPYQPRRTQDRTVNQNSSSDNDEATKQSAFVQRKHSADYGVWARTLCGYGSHAQSHNVWRGNFDATTELTLFLLRSPYPRHDTTWR
jgi:hypothetical protein